MSKGVGRPVTKRKTSLHLPPVREVPGLTATTEPSSPTHSCSLHRRLSPEASEVLVELRQRAFVLETPVHSHSTPGPIPPSGACALPTGRSRLLALPAHPRLATFDVALATDLARRYLRTETAGGTGSPFRTVVGTAVTCYSLPPRWTSSSKIRSIADARSGYRRSTSLQSSRLLTLSDNSGSMSTYATSSPTLSTNPTVSPFTATTRFPSTDSSSEPRDILRVQLLRSCRLDPLPSFFPSCRETNFPVFDSRDSPPAPPSLSRRRWRCWPDCRRPPWCWPPRLRWRPIRPWWCC